MQSCDLVASITAVACAIAKCSTKEELAVLVSAFTQLGQTLQTILLQDVANEELEEANKNTTHAKEDDNLNL
jgi:hypothetical protein